MNIICGHPSNTDIAVTMVESSRGPFWKFVQKRSYIKMHENKLKMGKIQIPKFFDQILIATSFRVIPA
jgi:hypothetical protein